MRLALLASSDQKAQDVAAVLRTKYKFLNADDADVFIALGGDGFMLETLHATLPTGKAIYGMNCGSVGFLMNGLATDGLLERVTRAEQVTLFPLQMLARTRDGQQYTALAINEVSLLRETRQAAKLRLLVDNVIRLEELVSDGLIVSTAAGSTAYNLSANGPILPLGTNLLAMTPLSPFRPRRWRGALLPSTATVQIDILEAEKRPVSAVADFTEVRDVQQVIITENRASGMTLLFDPEHNLEERILREQFLA